MKEIYPVIEPHSFTPKDFVGGDAVLDFVNTVTGRDEVPRDWLDGYPRLLEWAAHAKLLPDKALHSLEKMARADPAAAAEALQHAKELREALFVIITAMIARKTPGKGAMDALSRYWRSGVAAHELRYEASGVRLQMSAAAVDLELIASLIAYRFVESILAEPLERLRICAGNNCSWLFLDRSKAGRRRWCDMAVCGNNAKSRRFQARAREEKSVGRIRE